MADQDDNQILADELGRLAAKGGEIGGGMAGRWGGQMGVAWVAQRLPNDTFEITATIDGTAAAAMAQATNVFNQQGKLSGVQESAGVCEVKGVIGAGFLNMNPAVVTVSIHESAPGQVQVAVRGTAKEGLIKQHAGEKAARRIAQALFGGG